MKHTTREAWLSAAITLMVPLFKSQGYDVPLLRVACGWPSIKGLSQKNRRIGECWDSAASADGLHQIFISPYLEATDGIQDVLATLVHEVVHAVVGIKEKHGKVFGQCARAVGLEGKMTATTASDALLDKIGVWCKSLEEYPHAKLDMLQRPTKKQGTRMIKMECGTCGYIARTSQKWIDDVGPCHCPGLHGEMSVDNGDKKDESEEGEE